MTIKHQIYFDFKVKVYFQIYFLIDIVDAVKTCSVWTILACSVLHKMDIYGKKSALFIRKNTHKFRENPESTGKNPEFIVFKPIYSGKTKNDPKLNPINIRFEKRKYALFLFYEILS